MHNPKWLVPIAFTLALSSLAIAVDRPSPGKNRFVIRGQSQDVYFIAGSGSSPHRRLIYAPGEGGWRGFGIAIAQKLASAGYDVFGLDTHRYLQSFSASALTPSDIAQDWRRLAEWIREPDSDRVLLVGWSEGAGLCLAAAADPRTHQVFSGVVTIGATPQNILAWHWSDIMAEVRKTVPNEPTFASADYIGKIAPLPLFMIASTKDEYISVEATRALFAKAGNPKRLAIIESSDHKFGGNTDEFFRTMIQAAAWVWANNR